MKRTNIIQAAKKTTVAALTALMLFSGVPTRAIAEVVDEAIWTLSQQQTRDAADVEQPADEQSSPRAVVFDGNGATDGWMDPLAVGDDADTPLSANAYVRNGYEFTGWSTTPSGKDEGATPAYAIDATATVRGLVASFDKNQDGQIGDEERADLTALASNGTVTLYAQWAQKDNPSEVVPVMSQGDAVALQQDATLVDAPMLADNEVAELDAAAPEAARSVAGVTSAAANDPDGSVEDAVAGAPTSADGTSIDSMSVSWITEDTEGHEDNDPKKLTLAPYTNEKFDVRMRVSFQLSGQNDYEPGTIRLTIPKTLIKTRDGKTMGTFTLSVPEAPSDRAAFAYYEQDDSYVLVNMVKLAASTSALFEFSQRDVVPSQVMGNPKKTVEGISPATFASALEVTTPKGTTLARNDSMTATVETSKQLIEDSGILLANGSKLYKSWQDSWPANLKPDNSSQYVYIDWFADNDAKGNQAYVSAVKFEMLESYPAGSLLLGVINTDGTIVKAPAEATKISTDWSTSPQYGDMLTMHAYVAVPRDKADDGNAHTFKAAVEFSLKEVDVLGTDDERVTTSKLNGTLDVPESAKPKENKSAYSSFSITKGSYEYSDALDRLLAGKDVSVTYDIRSYQNGGYKLFSGSPLEDGTYSPDQVKDDATMHTVITDDGVSWDGDLSGAMSSDDYELQSIRFGAAEAYGMYKLTQDEMASVRPGSRPEYLARDSWAYYSLDRSFVPDQIVEAKRADGSWIGVATVSYKTKAPVVTLAAGVNGVSVGGAKSDTLTFAADSDYTGFRITSDTKVKVTDVNGDPVLLEKGQRVLLGALETNVAPTIRIKANSAKTVQRVQEAMKESAYPILNVENVARGETSCNGNVERETSGRARARLRGGSLVYATSKQDDIIQSANKAQQRYDLVFTNRVHERTGLSDRGAYDEAVRDGLIKSETSGTFYDLLPKGVFPDTSSIELRPGDKVESVEVLRNYKNSGRTLLKVHATLNPQPMRDAGGSGNYADMPYMKFKATYSFGDAWEFGAKITNIAAFESDNAQLGNVMGYMGERSDAITSDATKNNLYNNKQTADAVRGYEDVLNGLNAESDSKSFLYSRAEADLGIFDHAIVSGLDLKVAANGTGAYGQGNKTPVNVCDGGSYVYQLRYSSTKESGNLKNIVLYNNLEVAAPQDANAGDETWRGTFTGIDVSAMRAAGANPVVYYAVKDVDLSKKESLDLDLSDGTVWSTTAPSDLSQVRAVAVDVSRAADGSEFTLAQGKSVSALVCMQAPRAEDLAKASGHEATDYYDSDAAPEVSFTGGAHAYNASVATFEYASGDKQYAQSATAKVGLSEYVLTVEKKWDDGDDADFIRPGEVKIELLANGVHTGRFATLAGSNNWKETFSDVPTADEQGNPIRYTIAEEVPDGYHVSQKETVTQTVEPHYALSDDFVLTNYHEPERTSFAGVKVWNDGDNGAGKRPGSIKVDLYADGKLEQSQTVYGGAGSIWNYSFDDLRVYSSPNTPIVYTVNEQYVAGYITSIDESGTITNTYDPYGDLVISETLKNATGAAIAKKPSFKFKLDLVNPDGSVDGNRYAYEVCDTASGAVISTGFVGTGKTVVLGSGQSARVKGIASETRYSVVQIDDAGFELVNTNGEKGSIQAGEAHAARADFVNLYASKGAANITALKVLDGGTLRAGQYAFQLTSECGTLQRKAYNDKNGKVDFGKIRYTEADDGKTFKYDIKEIAGSRSYVTYSTNSITATVLVTDNGDGTMACAVTYVGGDGTDDPKAEDKSARRLINTYSASGKTTLIAWKTLENGELADGQYTFKVEPAKDSPNAPMPTATEAANGADGMITFGPINYSQDSFGKSYSYLVSEIAKDNDKTTVYDKSSLRYTVTPIDNGDGTISFDQKVVRVKEDGTEEEIDAPVFQNKAVDGSLRVEKYVKRGDATKEFTFWLKLTGKEGQMPDSINPSLEQLRGSSPNLASKTVTATVDDADQSGGVLETIAGWGSSLLSLFAPTEANAETIKGKFTGDKNTATYTYDTKTGGVVIHAGVLVTDVQNIFNNTDGKIPYQKVKSVVFDDGVEVADAFRLFDSCDKLESVSGTPVFTSEASDLDYLFKDCSSLKNVDGLAGWDVSGVNSFRGTFSGCSSLQNIDGLRSWKPNKIQYLEETFSGCENLVSIDALAGWDVSGCGAFTQTFAYCRSLESLAPLKNWNIDLPAYSHFSETFAGCTSLKSLDGLQGWDLSNCMECSSIFEGCTGLEDIDAIQDWTFPIYGGYIYRLFGGCQALKSVTVSSSIADVIVANRGTYWDWPDWFTSIPPHNSLYTGNWVLQKDGSQTDVVFSNEQEIYDYIVEYQYETPMTFVWETTSTAATIRFDANGASGSMSYLPWETAEGTTLPACSFAKYDCSFVGWNTNADGTGNSYADRAVINKGSSDFPAGSTTTLYAQWKAKDHTAEKTDRGYKITLHGNEAATITGLPAGMGYQLLEETSAGWVLVGSSGASGVIKSGETSTATFVNDYQPAKARVAIQASKTLDGLPAKDGAFEFGLYGNDDTTPLLTTSNAVGGGVSFGAIEYSEAGTYKYKIREIKGSDPTINYSDAVYDVTVTVSDKDDVLSASVKYYDNHGLQVSLPVFQNTTKTTSLTSLTVRKEVEGPKDKTQDFTFQVKIGSDAPRTIKLKADEERKFDGLKPGTAYSVTEVDLPSGYTTDRALYSGTIDADGTKVTVTNKYSESSASDASVGIKVAKKLEGGTLVGGEFKFGLYKKDKSNAEDPIAVAYNDAFGNVAFSPVSVSEDTKFDVREIAETANADVDYDGSVKTVAVKVTDNGHGTKSAKQEGEPPVFTNTMKTGTLVVSNKLRSTTAASKGKRFVYTLTATDEAGEPLKDLAITYPDGTSEVISSGATFKLGDGEKASVAMPSRSSYNVVQTDLEGFTGESTGSTGSVDLRTEETESAVAAFVNTYYATGFFTPKVKKEFQGEELQADAFSFELRDAAGALIATTLNAADGTVAFSNVAFEQKDFEHSATKNLSYTVTEVKGARDDVEYDLVPVTVSVTVTDDGEGNLVAGTPTYVKDGATGSDTITNLRTVVLPKTGAAGIWAGVIAGLAIVTASVIAIIRRRKQ